MPGPLLRAAAQARALRGYRDQFVECVPEKPQRKPKRVRKLSPAKAREALRLRVEAIRRSQAERRARLAVARGG